MNLCDLFSANVPLDGDAAMREVTGIAIDSRAVKPGNLFFALAGTKTDGSKFITQAIENGAVAIVSDRAGEAAVPMIVVPNPRRALALAAARFYRRQPATIAAVTGTSGKTSVAAFVRQVWQRLSHQAASIGTIGIVAPTRTVYGSLTTPDPVVLHRDLDELAGEGVTHLALEASSHGLDQFRLDGVRVAAGGFTNLSRDHMDYHPTVEHYLAAKLRLFTHLILDGGTAVVSADHAESAKVIEAARARHLRLITVGRNGDGIRLANVRVDGFAQLLTLAHDGKTYDVRLPLVGDFQIENALVAAGLAIATGGEPAAVFDALAHLEGAKGRLELIGEHNGAPVFVDYAHKPDALEKALAALRPYAKRKLVVVFGAGGDRDQGKRPLMGEIAARVADTVIITDDNPRSEDPATIRAAILAAAPRAHDIGDRAEAIRFAVSALESGDALLIAGKGHETGQIVGATTLPFSDHDEARAALIPHPNPPPQSGEGRKGVTPLWTVAEVARALGLSGDFPATPIDAVTQDSRLVKPGTLFVALSGTPSGGFISSFASARDGWEFAEAAEKSGAIAMIVPHAIDGISVPQLIVKDTLIDGLWALAHAARVRFSGPVIGLTGSAGKTSVKEFIGAYPRTFASPASFNNFWGVPLTLCNADPSASAWVVEMGMNQPGEINRLSELAKPTVALVVNVKPVHLEKLGSLEAIRHEKVSIAEGLPENGVLVLPHDIDAPEWRGKVLRFGDGTETHEVGHTASGESWSVTADVRGRRVTFTLTPGAPHRVLNALAALASVEAAGFDPAALAANLEGVGIMTGRGVEQSAGGIIVIDDSFNGNPASMQAALDSLAARPVTKGRRIAILGDMLELGGDAPRYHTEMAAHLDGIDAVYCVGPLMKHLHGLLPKDKSLGWTEDAGALDPAQVAKLLRPGDVVVVKGSKKMFWVNKFVSRLVTALQAH